MKIILEQIMTRWQAYYDGDRDNFRGGATPQEALESLIKKSNKPIQNNNTSGSYLLYTCPVCDAPIRNGSDDCPSCGFKNCG